MKSAQFDAIAMLKLKKNKAADPDNVSCCSFYPAFAVTQTGS